MGTPAIVSLARLGVGSADPVDKALNFSSFNPNVNVVLRDLNGMRGTYDKDANRTVPERNMIGPSWAGEPTAAELLFMLEWVMGGTPTGTTTKTFPQANAPKEWNIHYKPNAGLEWFLGGVAIDTWTMQAAQGEPLTASAEMVGKTYDASRSNMPTLSYDQTTRPFMLNGLVLTHGGSSVACRGFTWRVVKNIQRDRHLNSMNLTDLVSASRQYTLAVEVPSGDYAAKWDDGLPKDGVSAVAAFTNAGGGVLTLTFPLLRYPGRSPDNSGAESFMTLDGEAYRVGAGSPITVTLVQDP